MRTSYNVLFEEGSIVVTLAVFLENDRDREVLDQMTAALSGRQQLSAAINYIGLALNGRGYHRLVAALHEISLNCGRWQLEYGKAIIGKPMEHTTSHGNKVCYFPIRFGKPTSERRSYAAADA